MENPWEDYEIGKVWSLEHNKFWSQRSCFFMDGVLYVERMEWEMYFSDLFHLEADIAIQWMSKGPYKTVIGSQGPDTSIY